MADPRQQAQQAGGPLGLEALAVLRVEQGAFRGAQARGGAGGALSAGAARQGREALRGEDVADPAQAGAVAGLGVEAGLDVGQRQVRLAQLDDALAEFVRRLAGASAGRVGRSEEVVEKAAGSSRRRKSRVMA